MSVDRVEELRAEIRAWWAWRVQLGERENRGEDVSAEVWDNDDEAVDLLMKAADLLGVTLELGA